MKRITVMAYAVNGSGLGHLTRVLAVMRWMKRLALFSGYALDGYVLTTSEADGLALAEGFAGFKIPSKTAVRNAGINKSDYVRLARQWVWHSVGLVRPDILLVDTFPGGSFGELVNALDSATRRVFIKRAMKDEMENSAIVQAILPLYDAIIVPSEPGAADELTDERLAARSHYVGPIMLRSREEIRPREEARQRLGVPEDKLAVWISAGGGGDQTANDSITTIVNVLSEFPDLHLIVGAGPLYRGNPIYRPHVTWLNSYRAVDDFAALDFAISAAGFNTFYELLHNGVPSAFFSQEKIADEQHRRIKTAVDAGAAIDIGAERGIPDPHSLNEALALLLSPEKRQNLKEKAEDFVPVNSARQAAFHCLESVIPHETLTHAMDIATYDLFNAIEVSDVEVEEAAKTVRSLQECTVDGAVEHTEGVIRMLSYTPGSDSLRILRGVARRFNGTNCETEEIVDTALRYIIASAPFGDVQGSLRLLSSLPVEMQQPSVLAGRLESLLSFLREKHESLWRAVALISRTTAENPALSQAEAIEAVKSIIDNEARQHQEMFRLANVSSQENIH